MVSIWARTHTQEDITSPYSVVGVLISAFSLQLCLTLYNLVMCYVCVWFSSFSITNIEGEIGAPFAIPTFFRPTPFRPFVSLCKYYYSMCEYESVIHSFWLFFVLFLSFFQFYSVAVPLPYCLRQIFNFSLLFSCTDFFVHALAAVCSSFFAFMNVDHKITWRQIFVLQKRENVKITMNKKPWMPRTQKLCGHNFPGYFSYSLSNVATCFRNLYCVHVCNRLPVRLLRLFGFTQQCFTFCKTCCKIAALLWLCWLKIFTQISHEEDNWKYVAQTYFERHS